MNYKEHIDKSKNKKQGKQLYEKLKTILDDLSQQTHTTIGVNIDNELKEELLQADNNYATKIQNSVRAKLSEVEKQKKILNSQDLNL